MIRSKSNVQLLLLVCVNYFSFALITNVIGALIPYWKDSFQLSATAITLLGSMFYLAYGLTSLPQGVLIDKIGNKKMFLFGVLLILFGSAVFALNPNYKAGLIALFVVGIGVTTLQLVGNLLVKKIDENTDKYSRNLALTQVFCGIGGFASGILTRFLLKTLGLGWQSIYYVFIAMGIILAILVLATKIPEIAQEKSMQPDLQEYLKLIKNPSILFFAGGIFIYKGILIGIASWLAIFLINAHHFDKADAALIVGLYWGFQSLGRLLGGIMLHFIDSSRSLIIYSVCCLVSLLIAVNASLPQVSVFSFVMVGFFTSIIFPCIFSLAVNSFDQKYEGTIAGILCTAFIGCAIVPPVIGLISDATKSLTLSLSIVGSIAFLYVATIGVYALFKTDKSNQNDDLNELCVVCDSVT